MIFSGSLSAQPAREVLRKPISKGAYKLVYIQGEDALYLATSRSSKLDNDIKPLGAAINNKTNMLFFSNTVNSTITAIDAKTGEVMRRLVLDLYNGSLRYSFCGLPARVSVVGSGELFSLHLPISPSASMALRRSICCRTFFPLIFPGG